MTRPGLTMFVLVVPLLFGCGGQGEEPSPPDAAPEPQAPGEAPVNPLAAPVAPANPLAAPVAPANPLAAPSIPSHPLSAPATAPDRSLDGCARAYFGILDFARTEAWGRESVTPVEVVRRCTALLKKHLAELEPEVRAEILRLPDTRAALLAKWAAADADARAAQREHWRVQLLLPNPLVPVAGVLKSFASEAGNHTFEYPADWILAQTGIEDAGYLLVAPPGTETTWERALHPATCPPAVVFTISPMEDGLKAAASVEAGTRWLARKYVTGCAPEMREATSFTLGPAGFVLLRGNLPGREGEHFVWFVSMPFRSDQFFAGRFLAPVARAEELLPAFSTILSTSEVTRPDEYAELMVDLAASTIGNAVMAASWR